MQVSITPTFLEVMSFLPYTELPCELLHKRTHIWWSFNLNAMLEILTNKFIPHVYQTSLLVNVNWLSTLKMSKMWGLHCDSAPKTLPVILASHISAWWLKSQLLHFQSRYLMMAPRKAAEDVLSAWTPALMLETQMKFLAAIISLAQPLQPFRKWTSKWRISVSLPLCL